MGKRMPYDHRLVMKVWFVVLAAAILTSTWGALMPRAAAHASAESMTPEPNARLAESPAKVEIAFNEAIETGIGALEVLDAMSKPVTNDKFTVSDNRRAITLELPKLGEGVYTVAYRILSADGHPVNGSYVFVVGDPPAAKDASLFDLHKDLGHSGHEISTQVSTSEFILYLSRGLYYGALLLASGLMIWYALLRRSSDVIAAMFRKWGQWTMRGLLLATLLYVFLHAKELMVGQPVSEWGKLFTKTETGMLWILLIVFALIGFIVLKTGKAVRLIWAVIILGLESLIGHAAAYHPKWYAVLLDFVHLGASAVWAGGVAFLLVLWFEERKEAGRFALEFTRAAWISIVLLTLSGVLMAVLFLPDFSYLFYTGWGTFLIIKTVLVVFVIIVGALLRKKVVRGNLPDNLLLRIDGALMVIIILIVGIFTYISPLPANEPFSNHRMGEKLHVTLRITPNVPGENNFIIKVWLPEQKGEPKSVRLLLHSQDKKDMGPIQVPLEVFEDEETDAFDGFAKFTYTADGPFIPFPGKWEAKLEVFDKQDNLMTYEAEFRNY
ncbi:copper resistance protein CopC [Paenibacillaceae bacterium]|nr:copper resistance protein CopC [Paenibacillaceae bacterium]